MSEDGLEARAAHAERLLDQLQVVAGPSTWPLIEDLVRALLEVHGAGLHRLLEVARAETSSVERLNARVADDEGLSGLLALHDLHPLSTEARVERAIARVTRELASPPATIEIASIRGGSVALTLANVVDRPSAEAYAQLVSRAIQRAAPEIADVRIEGLSSPPAEALIPAERLHRARP